MRTQIKPDYVISRVRPGISLGLRKLLLVAYVAAAVVALGFMLVKLLA